MEAAKAVHMAANKAKVVYMANRVGEVVVVVVTVAVGADPVHNS